MQVARNEAVPLHVGGTIHSTGLAAPIMRLINASTIRLESFTDRSAIPRYAILSHTWGEFEVTFQQFTSLSTLDSKTRKRILASDGYWKILKSCKQALEDGLGYVWVCMLDFFVRSLSSDSLLIA